LGARVTTEQQFREAAAQDRAATVELADRLAEKWDLHVEMGQFGHDGPPFFAAVMPRVVGEGLRAAQYGPDGETRGSPKQIKWGALIGLPGYAEDQHFQVDALKQGLANYATNLIAETALIPVA
jgi:hypothetical protein